MEKQKNIPALRFPEFEGEWQEKRLENLFSEFKSGYGITSSNILEIGEYPVYGGNGLRGYTNQFTHEGFYLLIGRQGALCGNINRSYGKAYISEHAIACTANESSDTEWLAQRLAFYNLNRLSESSAQPGLSVNKLLRFKLTFPTLPEQQKIATFFTAIDQKISNLIKKHQLLEQYKKGVMQQIFSQKIRFKDDDGREFPKWEKKTLGNVSVKRASTVAANTIEDKHGEYPIYGATGFLKCVDFYLESDDYISIVKDGAGVGRLHYCKGSSSVLGTLDIIKPKAGLNTFFLYLLLSQIDFTKFITGSTIPHIYYKDYSKKTLSIPCEKEQTKIANFLSAIDDKINHTKKQIEKAEVWKKGLMQQMFV